MVPRIPKSVTIMDHLSRWPSSSSAVSKVLIFTTSPLWMVSTCRSRLSPTTRTKANLESMIVVLLLAPHFPHAQLVWNRKVVPVRVLVLPLVPMNSAALVATMVPTSVLLASTLVISRVDVPMLIHTLMMMLIAPLAAAPMATLLLFAPKTFNNKKSSAIPLKTKSLNLY